MNEGLPPIEITNDDLQEMEEEEECERTTKFVIDNQGNIRQNSEEDAPYIKPDHLVGDRLDQKELFVEYEFTFGRGGAKIATHGNSAIPKYREIRDEYGDIKNRYMLIVSDPEADPEEIEKVKQEIVVYRSKHPELYQ